MSEEKLSPDPLHPLRMVLDTNVVMALWHFADPELKPLLELVESRSATLLSRPECLEELQRVLAYVQFGIGEENQRRLLSAYMARVECVPADWSEGREIRELPRCGDRDDQKFVELAWEGRADVLLTRDKLVLRLARRAPLRGTVAILTPERFQAELFKSVEPGP